MKKIWKIFKKIAVGLFSFIIILKFSDYFHNAISSHIINILYEKAGYVAIAICILEFLISCYNMIDIKLKERMKKRYYSVVHNLRERFERSIINTPQLLSCSMLGQLLVAFYNDEKIFGLLICELKRRYESDNELKNVISYIFLENEQDNDIVQYFLYNPSNKKEFVDVSRKTSTEFVDELYNFNEPITSKYNINNILISLRHMCLPQNYIEKNKLIFVCRTLLDMIRERLEKLNFEENGKDISLFLICIPIIQKKILMAKIQNEYLDDKIREIKESTWANMAVKKAYDKILIALKNNNKDENDSEQIAYCVSLLSTYFNNLSQYRKIRLYYAIKKFNINVSSAYHSYTDDKIALLLVCSSIFSGVEEQQDLLDEAITLAYLCSNGVGSLQSQISGGSK